MSMKSVFDQEGRAREPAPNCSRTCRRRRPSPPRSTVPLHLRGKVAHTLRVVHFQGEDASNQPYELAIELVAPHNIDRSRRWKTRCSATRHAGHDGLAGYSERRARRRDGLRSARFARHRVGAHPAQAEHANEPC